MEKSEKTDSKSEHLACHLKIKSHFNCEKKHNVYPLNQNRGSGAICQRWIIIVNNNLELELGTIVLKFDALPISIPVRPEQLNWYQINNNNAFMKQATL